MSATQEYIKQVQGLTVPSFEKIREIATRSIARLPASQRNALHSSLEHGVALLETHEQLCYYLFSYGNMHRGKLKAILSHLSPELLAEQPLQVIDYGCGQGVATMCLFDYLLDHEVDIGSVVSRVVLIDTSSVALDRARLHLSCYLRETKLAPLLRYLYNITPGELRADEGGITLHLFSNILDAESVDVERLARTIASSLTGENYFLCVSPAINGSQERFDKFYAGFHALPSESLWQDSHPKGGERNFTGVYSLFRVERRESPQPLPALCIASRHISPITTLVGQPKQAYPTISIHALHQYILERVQSRNFQSVTVENLSYRDRYTVQDEGLQVQVDIIYNGKGEVDISGINVRPSNGEIEALFRPSQSEVPLQYTPAIDSLRTLHEALEAGCKQLGYLITNIIESQFRVAYILRGESGWGRLTFHYKGDGRISRVIPASQLGPEDGTLVALLELLKRGI